MREDDRHHEAALRALDETFEEIVTTWPCITEAMHLLRAQVGPHAQEVLRVAIEDGVYILRPTAQAEAYQVCTLMRTYADAPMDFADASLVAAAETLNVRRILTLDRHFYAYRIHGRIPFEVLPLLR